MPLHKKSIEPCALHNAIYNGESIDLIADLIRQGANIEEKDEGDETALFIAVRLNLTEVVRLLLAHGAQPDNIDSGIICFYQDLLCRHITYESSVEDCPEFRHSLINYALVHVSDEIIILLLQAGANITECEENGMSALDIALREKMNPEIIRLLIERGARIEETT